LLRILDFFSQLNIDLASGGIMLQINPGKTAHDSHSELRASNKRWERLMSSKMTNSITSTSVKRGPIKIFARSDELSTLECRICFRSINSLIELLLTDPGFKRAGFYSTKPHPLSQELVCAHYTQGLHYKMIYDMVLEKYPGKKFLLVPLVVWTDSVQFNSNRLSKGTGHPIMIALAGSNNPTTHLLGFLNIDNVITGAETRLSSILRFQSMASSLVLVFNELKKTQDEGGVYMKVWNEMFWVIPFIAYYCGDLPELKRVFPSTHCHLGCETRLNVETSKEIETIESEQNEIRLLT
jgi:hypothetical protein